MAKAEKKASAKAPVKKAIVKIAAKVVKTAAKAVAKTTAKAGSKNNSKVSSKVNSKSSVKENPKAAVKAKEKIVTKSAKPAAKPVLNVTPKTATVSKEVGKKKTTHLVIVEPAENSTIVKSEKPSILRAEFVTEKMAKPAKAPPLSSEAKAALKLEKKNKKLQDIALAGATENLKKWHELKAEYDGEVRAYKMSEQYEAKTAIEHKVLGWGFILSSENNRLDVMFEYGRKMLISNYKA